MLGKEFIESFELLSPAFAKPFPVSCHPKRTTVHKSTHGQMTKKANAQKTNEVQPTAPSQRYCTTFVFYQPHIQHSTDTFTENRIFHSQQLSIFTTYKF